MLKNDIWENWDRLLYSWGAKQIFESYWVNKKFDLAIGIRNLDKILRRVRIVRKKILNYSVLEYIMYSCEYIY